MNPGHLILASRSPRRSAMLRQVGLEFDIVPAETVEATHEYLSPQELGQLNSYRKARAVAKLFPDALVVGADTLVSLDTRIFGKPATLEEAVEMLAALQGRSHQVVTGVCFIHLRHHRQHTFAEATRVTFRPLGDEAIRRYLSLIQPLDKAGAYAIQEHGDLLVQELHGSYSNVVGFPIERFQRELQAWRSRAGET